MSCCLLCEEDREENSLEVTSAWHENNQLVSSQTYQTAKYSTRPDPGEHFFANPECKNNLPKQATSCQASNQRDRLNQRQSDYCRSHYKQHIQRKKWNGTEKHKKKLPKQMRNYFWTRPRTHWLSASREDWKTSPNLWGWQLLKSPVKNDQSRNCPLVAVPVIPNNQLNTEIFFWRKLTTLQKMDKTKPTDRVNT